MLLDKYGVFVLFVDFFVVLYAMNILFTIMGHLVDKRVFLVI